MSSPATAQPRRAAAAAAASPAILSTLYNVVLTPILFVSFLASLAWVDFRYSIMRSHSHSEDPSWLPHWLHRIVYRGTPYKYVKVNATNPKVPADGDEGPRWYYHSKQKKLMKMEVDDAFQIRSTVLVVLGLLALAATWALWWVSCWVRVNATTRLGWPWGQ